MNPRATAEHHLLYHKQSYTYLCPQITVCAVFKAHIRVTYLENLTYFNIHTNKHRVRELDLTLILSHLAQAYSITGMLGHHRY